MDFDIIVIGSGPGGYVAAIRASQLGKKVAVIEKSEVGGICLNWGCIPTKALLKSAEVLKYMKKSSDYGITVDGEIKPDFAEIIGRSRKIAGNMSKGVEFLFKKNDITLINGYAKLIDNKSVEVKNNDGETSTYKANHIILATGARSKNLKGIEQNGKNIIGYREALNLKNIPETMAVIGSGAIGTEFAYFYSSLGTRVTLFEYFDNVVPLEDSEVSKQLERALKKSKIKVLTGTSVKSVEEKDGKSIITYENKKGESEIEADIVLSAAGVIPNTENIGLEDVGVKTDNDNKVIVDEYYKTNVDGIYAIGDIIPGPALAHVASAEGICCVEKICDLNPEPIDYDNIPSCVYTVPEIASVGLSEDKAKEKDIDVKIGKFPFAASGKASATGSKDGFIKIVFDAKTDEVLGAHFIGNNVTEMIAEIVVAKKLKGRGIDILKSIHPHPSLSEAIMEAAAVAHDEAIHL